MTHVGLGDGVDCADGHDRPYHRVRATRTKRDFDYFL